MYALYAFIKCNEILFTYNSLQSAFTAVTLSHFRRSYNSVLQNYVTTQRRLSLNHLVNENFAKHFFSIFCLLAKIFYLCNQNSLNKGKISMLNKQNQFAHGINKQIFN